VHPCVASAKADGQEVGQPGGLRVDEETRTGNFDIFAVRDASQSARLAVPSARRLTASRLTSNPGISQVVIKTMDNLTGGPASCNEPRPAVPGVARRK
jgi:hypothetical protein